jgi:hypothetical protein
MFKSRRMLLLTPSSLRSAAQYSLTHGVVFARFDDVMYFLRRLDSQFDSTAGRGVFSFVETPRLQGPLFFPLV